MSKSQHALAGQRVSAVTFVEDYIQVALDDATINAVVGPEVREGGRWLRRGDVGYLDSLVALIGRKVIDSSSVPEVEFLITFDSDHAFRVSLAADSYQFGPEALTIQHRDGSFEVW